MMTNRVGRQKARRAYWPAGKGVLAVPLARMLRRGRFDARKVQSAASKVVEEGEP